MTTMWLSKKTKNEIEETRKRLSLGSLHSTLKYLIKLEKEYELSKLSLPTKDDIRNIIAEELLKVSGR